MRRVLCLLLLGGCFGTLDANGRPSVIPTLSEMPAESEKRDAILDQSSNTTGPENGKALTKKERKAVTALAIATAYIGSMFSKSANTTLGVSMSVDENRVVQRPAEQRTGDPDGTASPAPVHDEPLVPWIVLPSADR